MTSNTKAGADSSQVGLYHVEETSWGTTPASALNETRYTGESLNASMAHTTSNEIRDDRQVSGLVKTAEGAAGDINFEFSHGTYDDFMGAALQDADNPLSIVDTDIQASSSGSKFTSSGGGVDFSAEGLAVGQWIRVAGFSTTGANGLFKITSISGSPSEIGVTPAPATDANGGTPETITITGNMLRNGTTARSFSIEKKFSDLSNIYHNMTGMLVSAFSLALATGQIATGAFSFMGKSYNVAAATIGTGTPNPATTSDVLNTIGNVGTITEGGSSYSGYLRTLNVNLNNSGREQKAIGTDENVGIGFGRCGVTGSLEAYFEDNTLMTKALADTETSLSWRLTDADGNVDIITLPKIKLTNPRVVAGGADQDVVAQFDYTAFRDPTTDCTIQIDILDV